MNLIFIFLFLLEINKCFSDESMKMKCAMQQNQIYAKCGNKCKNTCKGLIEKNCPKNSCDNGCFCDEGYYRNERGSCVHKSQCNKEKKKDKKKEKKPAIYKKDKLKVKIKLVTDQPEDGVLTTQEPEEETSQGIEDETTQATEDESTQTSEEETTETSTEQTSEMSTEITSETETQTESTETSTQETEETTVATTEQDTTTEMTTQSTEATEEQTETTSELSTEVSTEETTTESSTLETTTIDITTKPPIKCKINEHYSSCGSKCGESCQTETDNSKANCLAKCDQGCFCDEGLLRNEKGICIPKDQCVCKIPEQKCKSANEQFFYCHNECGRTCDDQDEESNKNCPTKCSRGCLCKIGLVRNQNGICVLPDKCRKTQKKCKPNEKHSDCGTDCGKNCEDLAKNLTKTSCDTKKCNIGCFCSQGFYRNHKGVCVSKEKCTTKNDGKSKAKEDCQPFEEYTECGNFCTEICDTSKQNVENCPFTCNKGCICKKGLKRNADGVCVSEKKCKEKPECGKNEEYNDCGTECGNRCADLSKKNLQCPLACEKGCFCAKGFFRERNNTCIPKAKCSVDAIDCPESERYMKCGTRCGESCEDLKNPVPCPKGECEENCFCNKDLYRNLEGVCVKETECELESTEASKHDCPSNEVFKDCGNKCEESCEDRTDCKKKCQKGCFCDQGYLRHKSGKCVSDDECKAKEQCVLCAQNEFYTDCGTDCGNYCVDIGNQPKCEASCRKGCFCKHGFYKNDLGKCVPEEKCNDSPITETTPQQWYTTWYTTWYTEIYTYRVPYRVTPDASQMRQRKPKSKVVNN